MKGIFDDSKNWNIVVIGDWRDKNGKTEGYDEKLADKLIFISGGTGMYFYFKGEFRRAIHQWKRNLELIKKIEKEENTRFHKGWFYYQIAIAYQELKDIENERNYLKLAKGSF